MTEGLIVHDLSALPQLQEILSRGLLPQARIFRAVCTAGDALVTVLRIAGRPLAISRSSAEVLQVVAGQSEGGRRRIDHRRWSVGFWLDLDPLAYYLPYTAPGPGESVTLTPRRIRGECMHEQLSMPLDWLREQVSAGAQRRVVDEATRREMGARFRGE